MTIKWADQVVAVSLAGHVQSCASTALTCAVLAFHESLMPLKEVLINNVNILKVPTNVRPYLVQRYHRGRLPVRLGLGLCGAVSL